MTLSEIAKIVSERTNKHVSIGDINAQKIIEARKSGLISESLEEELLSELEKADGAWNNPAPGAAAADCL